MRAILLSAAMIVASAVPTMASGAQQGAFEGPANGGHRMVREGRAPGDLRACRGIDGPRRSHDRRAMRCAPLVGGWAYADGEWALYNNRSWAPDSYNDWWHDRPDRAFPRWVQEQRGGACAPDRMWWSGGGWRC